MEGDGCSHCIIFISHLVNDLQYRSMVEINLAFDKYNTEAWLRFKAHILLKGDAGKIYIASLFL